MNATAMVGRLEETPPRLKARITGVLYLLTILTGIFAGGFVSGRLVVGGDAAATATNILMHKSLFQLGFAVYLIEMACNVAMTALFYDLLKPAGKSVSLIAAFLGLTGCVIKTFSRVFFIAPLFILGGAHDLSVFSSEQLQALSLLFLKVNDHGAAIALVFFGYYAILTGYLIVRSTFLPRILGVLSILGGLGWLSFLYQPLGYRLFPYIAVLGIVGAASLMLWLLVFGVNEQRWKEQASAALSTDHVPHGEARTNQTRRISNETQRHVNHRVSALDPLDHASRDGRHRPRDGQGTARKPHCHSHPGRLAIRHAGAHRTATGVHHHPHRRDLCDGHARHPLEGDGNRQRREVQRGLLLPLDALRARCTRDIFHHPLGARTVEPAMGPVPVAQQPEHGKPVARRW
jgi:hypothetical protein